MYLTNKLTNKNKAAVKKIFIQNGQKLQYWYDVLLNICLNYKGRANKNYLWLKMKYVNPNL